MPHAGDDLPLASGRAASRLILQMLHEKRTESQPQHLYALCWCRSELARALTAGQDPAPPPGGRQTKRLPVARTPLQSGTDGGATLLPQYCHVSIGDGGCTHTRVVWAYVISGCVSWLAPCWHTGSSLHTHQYLSAGSTGCTCVAAVCAGKGDVARDLGPQLEDAGGASTRPGDAAGCRPTFGIGRGRCAAGVQHPTAVALA